MWIDYLLLMYSIFKTLSYKVRLIKLKKKTNFSLLSRKRSGNIFTF